MSEEQVIEFYYCCNCRHGYQPHEMHRDWCGDTVTAYCPRCDEEIAISVEPWTVEKANELSAMWGW
jgi:hypothetical protein